MHSSKLRSGMLLAMIVGLVVMTPTPVNATTIKTVEFAGNVTLTGCPGLAYPVVHGTPNPVPNVEIGPKGIPEDHVAPQGNHCNFDISDTLCLKTSTGKKTGEDLCSLDAFGSVWGFCGFATGLGVMVVNNLTGGKESVFTTFKFTVTGGLLRVSGGTMDRNVTGELLFVPTTGSCANKTATGFTLSGKLHLKICTNGTVIFNGRPSGVCAP